MTEVAMRQFYIPSIGDKIVLQRDWECTIFFDYTKRSIRAQPLFGTSKEIKKKFMWKDYKAQIFWLRQLVGSALVTFPSGTKLTIDRIYIRKGKGKWNSVTFSMPKQPKIAPFHGRFWAKLTDVNEIRFEKA